MSGNLRPNHVLLPGHMRAKPTSTVSCCRSELPFAAASGFRKVFSVPEANHSRSPWERELLFLVRWPASRGGFGAQCY